MNVKEYRDKLNQAKGRLSAITDGIKEHEKQMERKKKQLGYLEEAQTFLQKVAKETQEQLSFQIADIVQLALDSCFPGQYEFEVRFETRRGKTEAHLAFIKNGEEVDVMDSAGGGVVDVATFALRIAIWSMGHSDDVIILDEPFRFLSKDLQPAAGEIVRKLSHKLNLQVLMVTHNPDMIEVADKVFKVTMSKDGISKVSTMEAM